LLLRIGLLLIPLLPVLLALLVLLSVCAFTKREGKNQSTCDA
jgi:hypothetical protein